MKEILIHNMEEAKQMRLQSIRDGLDAEKVREQIDLYLRDQYEELRKMDIREAESTMISAINYRDRHLYMSCQDFGLKVNAGDICFMDFGRSYIKEAGFQHFGLVISVSSGKILVVPMTSNANTYRQAYDPARNPGGKTNLYALPDIDGLYKKSVLFLNDAKFINSARVFEVKAHISTGGLLFQDICRRLRDEMQI